MAIESMTIESDKFILSILERIDEKGLIKITGDPLLNKIFRSWHNYIKDKSLRALEDRLSLYGYINVTIISMFYPVKNPDIIQDFCVFRSHAIARLKKSIFEGSYLYEKLMKNGISSLEVVFTEEDIDFFVNGNLEMNR